ncbi:F-box/kelch-repeat protein At3g23880-like [Rhododendron vialii]|uniref:F-box/kelch-repeat protein At3g23880-like n=1 Tax=Rhododendron vialii TaxID=182163 RepID=UPI00265EC6DB|nr:F-box/kelch-repeat protein At3g23880-like [Rhododendron vialii]
MSEFESLPIETVTDIFIRLPFESLMQCMCVCKSWHSLIADPFFINRHLINQQGCFTDNDNCCFLLQSNKGFGDKFGYSLRCCKTFAEQKQLKVPNTIEGWRYMIIASCNGLLCLLMRNQMRSGYSRVLLLWNPSIKKFKILPRPKFQAGSSDELAHGFAFIPRANDYKVVRLIHNKIEGSPKVEIYTLSTNSWRTWIGDGIGCVVTNRCRPVFINGAVHWIALNKCRSPICSSLIIAFNMEYEVFRVIPSPRYDLPHPISYPCGVLFVVSEKLAYFVKHVLEGRVSWDLWVLEDYGVAEFWTKLHTIRLHAIGRFLYPLQPLKKGEILFGGLRDKKLYSFDLKRQEIKEIDQEADGLPDVINYTESLVLLNEGIPDSSSAAMIELKEKEKEEVKDKKEEEEQRIITNAMDFLKCNWGLLVFCFGFTLLIWSSISH